MPAAEINWAIEKLASVSQNKRLPRKMLIIDQFYEAVFSNKNDIKLNPDVSLVLQMDGFGAYQSKLGGYQQYVQAELLEYGGYKVFNHYAASPAYDIDNTGVKRPQTPQEVMRLFPQPLYISYQ